MPAPSRQPSVTGIYELLEGMRHRPGLYFRRVDLAGLQNFLDGYFNGYFRGYAVGSQNSRAPSEDPPFQDFATWLCLHRQMPGAAGGRWFGAIEHEEPDGRKGFDRFFELLDAFRARRIRNECVIDLTAVQRRAWVSYRWRGAQAERRALASHGLSFQKPPVRNRSWPARFLRLSRCRGERRWSLHARNKPGDSWGFITVYKSLPEARGYLQPQYGIGAKQWAGIEAKLRAGP